VAAARSESEKLVLLTGPSGVGKDTLAAPLLRAVRKLKRARTCTTQPRRAHEIRYKYISEATFRRKLAAGDFIESRRVYDGRGYGLERSELERILRSGKVPFLQLDPYGTKTVKRIFPSALSVFIRPPSIRELRRRLLQRHRDASKYITGRLVKANRELVLKGWDAVVENRTGRAKKAAQELIHTVRSYLAT
jgi:guanylate kinase